MAACASPARWCFAGSRDLAAFDAGTGRLLWQEALPDCDTGGPVGAHVVIEAGGESLAVLGCRPDGSDCTLVRHANGGGSDARGPAVLKLDARNGRIVGCLPVPDVNPKGCKEGRRR